MNVCQRCYDPWEGEAETQKKKNKGIETHTDKGNNKGTAEQSNPILNCTSRPGFDLRGGWMRLSDSWAVTFWTRTERQMAGRRTKGSNKIFPYVSPWFLWRPCFFTLFLSDRCDLEAPNKGLRDTKENLGSGRKEIKAEERLRSKRRWEGEGKRTLEWSEEQVEGIRRRKRRIRGWKSKGEGVEWRTGISRDNYR